MKRMLITGVTGLLGATLAGEAAASFDVIGLARSSEFPARCVGHRCDLLDEEKTLVLLEETRPEVIVHCAALTDVDRCEAEPQAAWTLHVEATLTLAKWAYQREAEFVFISTDSVFDGRAGNYCETDDPSPLNEYARTKLAGEEAARYCHPRALILRTNLYGWNFQAKLSLGEWIVERLMRRDCIKGFPDVRFNPLLVNDLAKIILELISCRASGVVHAGARNSRSKYEFALLLADAFGCGVEDVVPISVDNYAFKARRPKDTSLNVDKLSRLLERELPSVEEGLVRFKQLYDTGYPSSLRGRRAALPYAVTLERT
jgi:dTDP-4-dehydrorhamnose reductase